MATNYIMYIMQVKNVTFILFEKSNMAAPAQIFEEHEREFCIIV